MRISRHGRSGATWRMGLKTATPRRRQRCQLHGYTLCHPGLIHILNFSAERQSARMSEI